MKFPQSIIASIVFICLFFLNQNIYAAVYTWTGAFSNDWNNEANWDLTSTPGVGDEVFININGDIKINTTVTCKRITISSGLDVHINITSSGKLIVDVQDEDLDGIYIGSGLFENNGFLTVTNVLTSSGNAQAIDNRGTFVNTGWTEISHFDFNNTNGVERKAIFNMLGDSIINNGTINTHNINGMTIKNQGYIHNKNAGKIYFSSSSTMTGIENDGTIHTHFLNEGLLDFSLDEKAIFNFNGVFDNSGNIEIRNFTSAAGLSSINNIETFNNLASGVISIQNAKSIENGNSGNNGAFFNNYGVINTDNCSVGFRNRSFNTLQNDGEIIANNGSIGLINSGTLHNNGDVRTDSMSTIGIDNQGTWYNNDSLFIYNTVNKYQASLRNLGDFINASNGYLEVFTDSTRGVFNHQLTANHDQPVFTNNGFVNVIKTRPNSYGLYNSNGIWNDFGTLSITNSRGILNFLGEMKIDGYLISPGFRNSGELNIGAGHAFLDITGDFEASLGEINFSIGGTSPGSTYDQIRVHGDLKLNGDVNVIFSSGYSPNSFSHFDLFTFDGAIEGYVPNLNLSPNYDFTLRYNVDNVVRLDFNECGSGPTPVNTFLYTTGDWETSSSWSLGHVPKSCERVEIIGSPVNQKTVNINFSNAKCQSIYLLYGTLNIESAGKLEVDANFEKTSSLGVRGIFMQESTLINNGDFEVMNVEDSRGLEITDKESQLVNNGTISIKRVEGSSIYGILNRGLIENNSTINIIPLNADTYDRAIANTGEIVNNDLILTDGFITSSSDTSSIAGDGTFTCDYLEVGGYFSPGNSPGKIMVNGDLEINSSAQLEFEIEGSDGVGIPNGYDQLEVTGDLTLLGDLNVTIPNSFSPHIYDRFTLIKYGGSLTESYTETLDPAFASWSLESLAPNEINLVSTPICAYTKVIWDGSSNSKWDNLSNWEYNFVPIPCHEVLIPSTSIGPILQSTVNAKIQKLEIVKGSLDIQGTLKVDGRNQNKNLVSITQGSLENNGFLNITNGERYKGYGVFVDINSNLTNNDVMWVKNIDGDLSTGIINNGDFTNNGTLSIENINGIGIYNDRGALFDATKFGQVTMDICNTGIINRLNSTFYINCSFTLLSPVTDYAFYNTMATFRVDGSGHFIGVADAGQGAVNTSSGSLIVRGIVE